MCVCVCVCVLNVLTGSYGIYIYIYIKLNLEGIQYDIIDTSGFMLHVIFSQYFLP